MKPVMAILAALNALFSTNAALANDHEVDISYNAFMPDSIVIQAGDTVTWVHKSTFFHTVTTDPSLLDDPHSVSSPLAARPFHSGPLFLGDRFSEKFDVPGEYEYSCTIHRHMRGHITVQAPP